MKKILSKIRKRINNFIIRLKNTIYVLFYKENVIVVNACMQPYTIVPPPYNLGDELNYYLLQELTGKRILNLRDLLISEIPNFVCIGSIIDTQTNCYSIVWGGGSITDKRQIKKHPLKVCAVRGKFTRNYLLSQGIACPAIYGDPALLLPRIYVPKVKKIYKVGIIPHYVDSKNDYVQKLHIQMPKESTVIYLQGYKNFHNVIDAINECEYIISSSLHGCIISDAYNIPNLWIEFSDLVIGYGFKFRDYFSSVGRKQTKPIRIRKATRIEDLLKYKACWKPIDIDLELLLSVCPFKIIQKYASGS